MYKIFQVKVLEVFIENSQCPKIYRSIFLNYPYTMATIQVQNSTPTTKIFSVMIMSKPETIGVEKV